MLLLILVLPGKTTGSHLQTAIDLQTFRCLDVFFTWLPITNYSHIVDTSHKTRAFVGFQFSPFATGISFSLLPSNMSFGPSRMPAENSRDFSPEDVCPRKACGINAVSCSSLLGGRWSNFQLNIFKWVAKDTAPRNCLLWNIIPTFGSWKELIYLGDFFLSRNRSPTRRSWQNFFLSFTDRYDQFEANAKTCMRWDYMKIDYRSRAFGNDILTCWKMYNYLLFPHNHSTIHPGLCW